MLLLRISKKGYVSNIYNDDNGDDDGHNDDDGDDENDQRKNDECLTLTNAKADLLHVPTLLPPLLYKPAAALYFTFHNVKCKIRKKMTTQLHVKFTWSCVVIRKVSKYLCECVKNSVILFEAFFISLLPLCSALWPSFTFLTHMHVN